MKVNFFKLCAFTSSVRPQHVRDTYSQRIGQTACGAIATSISAATTTLVQRNTILSHHSTTRVDVTSVTHYSLHTQQNETSKKIGRTRIMIFVVLFVKLLFHFECFSFKLATIQYTWFQKIERGV